MLVASPDDVEAERAVIVDVIRKWNAAHAAEMGVVLIPVMWETHSAPELGRPQGIINRQVVDPCDLAVGVLWTRLGTPTGEAASGTVEEVERMANAGKLVMLYFSSARPELEKLDLQQVQAVRDFKSRLVKERAALIGTYSTLHEFRERISRELEMQVREVVAKQGGVPESRPPGVAFQVEFANSQDGQPVGKTLDLSTNFLTIQDFEDLPDYGSGEDEPKEKTISSLLTFGKEANRDYYRQAALFMIYGGLFRPIRWFLRNDGSIGGRDVYVDVLFHTSEPVLMLKEQELAPAAPTRMKNSLLGGGPSFPASPGELLVPSTEWQFAFEVGAAQPTRPISPKSRLMIGATKDCTVDVVAKIYADTLAEPSRHELRIHFKVVESTIAATDWVELLNRADAH